MAYKSKKKRQEEALAKMATSIADSASSADVSPEPIIVEDEVDVQNPEGTGFGDLIGRAAENLHSGVTGEAPAPTKKKWKSSGQSNVKQREEITTLMVALITMGVAGLKVPDELKPTEDEIDAFSLPATRMLLRHVNLSGRVTADVVDAIGMIAVISTYYTRTAPLWRQYNPPKPRVPQAYRVEEDGRTTPIDEEGPIDPIANIDPPTAAFLDSKRRKHGNNGSPDAT